MTLVFQGEPAECRALARELVRIGVDAHCFDAAVFAEWDGFFGRDSVAAVMAAFT